MQYACVCIPLSQCWGVGRPEGAQDCLFYQPPYTVVPIVQSAHHSVTQPLRVAELTLKE